MPRGGFICSQWVQVVALPEKLSVGGDLDLTGCEKLEALPEGLNLGGELCLINCKSLVSLPKGLTSIFGNLNLFGCISMLALPEELRVTGNLNCSQWTQLVALPEKLSVGGDLDLTGCEKLETLPEELNLGGGLCLKNCKSLVGLPKGLTSISGNLDLFGCVSMLVLPEELRVTGNLNCSQWTQLVALPEKLSVGGSLKIKSWTRLVALPEKLSVGGDLDLTDCKKLETLPEGLSVDRHIRLTGCESMITLPNWIEKLGCCANGMTRHIFLEGTSLPYDIINRLMHFHEGIRFHTQYRQNKINFSDYKEAFLFWQKIAEVDFNIENIELSSDEQGLIKELLERLTTTPEYSNSRTRMHLAWHVCHIFHQIRDNPGLKETYLHEIHLGLTSCENRVSLTLNNLQISKLVYETQKKESNEQDLRKLALRLLKLEKTMEAAREYAKKVPLRYQVEVELLFQISLKDFLDLPVVINHMTYGSFTGATYEEIYAIGQEIKAQCSEEALENYLRTWDPWKRHLRISKIKKYSSLPIVDLEGPFVCSIMMVKANLPILLKENDTICDYDALVKSYVNNGKNPFTGTDLDWEKVFRVQV